MHYVPVQTVKLVREGSVKMEERPQVRSPHVAYEALKEMTADLPGESFFVLSLNTKNRIIGITEVYRGTIDTAHIRVAEVFRTAILNNATAIVVAHNHPSGEPEPSPEDIKITRKLVEAGKLLGIDVLDHIIVGDERYISLKERGLM